MNVSVTSELAQQRPIEELPSQDTPFICPTPAQSGDLATGQGDVAVNQTTDLTANVTAELDDISAMVEGQIDAAVEDAKSDLKGEMAQRVKEARRDVSGN